MRAIPKNHSAIIATTATIIIFIAINSLFQLISIHFGYKRFFFNAEWLAAILLASFRMPKLSILLSVYAITQEFSLGLSSTLFLFDFWQIVNISRFILNGNHWYTASFFVFLFMLLWLVHSCAFRIVPQAEKRHIVILVASLLAMQAALSFREGNFKAPELMTRSYLFAGSSSIFTHRVIAYNKTGFDIKNHDNVDYHPISHDSAMQIAMQRGAMTSDRIFLIIAESWGMPHEAIMLQQQIHSLQQTSKVKDFYLGEIQTMGATAFAEFRELCGKIPTKLNLKNIDKEKLGFCLPQFMHQKGYTSIALHGALGGMYDRNIWYPTIGFNETIFRESLILKSGYDECYSFPGLCDRDLFSLAAQKITSSNKIFLYWLTLNSHLPFDKMDVENYRKELCDASYSSQLCNYQNLHVQFFEGLASMINEYDLSGTEVLVVGDHPPPFGDIPSGNFFKSRSVPMIYFRIE